jgi:endonuclease YncB( thermonuclease family)
MLGGHQKRPGLSALIALGFISLGVQAETFSAKVIVVIDGDTVMVLREGGGNAAGFPLNSHLGSGQKIKIRLADIDAPEKDQPFGKQSHDALLEMVGKKQVQIDSRAVDQYGRTVGLITLDGRNVNQEQVRRGMAWADSHYRRDNTYVSLQREAQQARRGLWAQTNPQAPWQWRKLHPSPFFNSVAQAGHQETSRLATPVMSYGTECGNKTRCSQMLSCDEAYFYLARCGVKMLDGNHDGVPCESLCGGKN